jgi:hypothetical protein
MTALDLTADALADARKNILKFQEKVTDGILKMAAEVEKLAAVIDPSQARAFLKAHCNLPASELSTLTKFTSTLKGSEDVLRGSRASFSVMKALVGVDDETHREVIKRMELGAQLDVREIGAIRRKLAESRMTNAEILATLDRRYRIATMHFVATSMPTITCKRTFLMAASSFAVRVTSQWKSTSCLSTSFGDRTYFDARLPVGRGCPR